MVAALPFIAVAASVAGAGAAAYGAIQSGNAASAADNYNAEVAAANATAATQQAQQNAMLQQQQAKQQLGSVVASYGASGVDAGSGSALDVLSMSASNAELDRQTILYKGQLQANGYTDEAQLDSSSAANAGEQGDLKAASSLLTGAANVYSKIPGSAGSGTAGSSDNLSGNGSSNNISGGQ